MPTCTIADLPPGVASRGGVAPFSAERCDVALEPDFDWLGGEFARLFAASTATAFQHPIWLSSFFRILAPSRGAQGVIITGRDRASGALRFVLPMILRTKSGVTLLEATDLGVGDYAAPVIEAEWLALHAAASQDIAERIAALLPRHDTLRIRPVRDEHLALWRLFFRAESQALDFSAHATTLEADADRWRSRALSPSFQRYLERKRKRFAKAPGARVRRIGQPSEAAAAINRLAALRAGRFDGDPIQQPAVLAFYAEVASAGTPSGMARAYVAEIDGELVGCTFAIASGGQCHYLLIGCDYERHGRLSPGLVLYDAMIVDWIAAGGSVFDFTIGDEAFKADFGVCSTPMHIISHQATMRGRIAAVALSARERLRALSLAGRAARSRASATAGDAPEGASGGPA